MYTVQSTFENAFCCTAFSCIGLHITALHTGLPRFVNLFIHAFALMFSYAYLQYTWLQHRLHWQDHCTLFSALHCNELQLCTLECSGLLHYALGCTLDDTHAGVDMPMFVTWCIALHFYPGPGCTRCAFPFLNALHYNLLAINVL